ncbi:MAG: hypothetical protein IJ819_05275 [Clostridiales bacterium]|nr:hypothetical protein [Clostridiales bacterium]
MFGWVNVTTNVSGIPYLKTSSVSVGTETVDFALGFRRIPPVGYLTVNIADAIPTGTTGTLPVRFTLNGNTRELTFFGGTSVTAADLVGTGVVTIFYNWYDGILQLTSPLAPTA